MERARAEGWQLAVATASRTPDLLLDGAGFGGLFDVVVSRDDVERTKPAPDLYLRAAADLGVDPARCVVIEDSPAGIASGVAAGMRVIALTTSEPPPRLSQADEIVDGFEAIDLDAWRERLHGGRRA